MTDEYKAYGFTYETDRTLNHLDDHPTIEGAMAAIDGTSVCGYIVHEGDIIAIRWALNTPWRFGKRPGVTHAIWGPRA